MEQFRLQNTDCRIEEHSLQYWRIQVAL